MNFDKLKQKIEGPVCSVITPFDDQLQVDYESLFKYISNAADKGINKFYTMQYCSRLNLLTRKEIFHLNKAVIKYVKDNVKNSVVIVSPPKDCPAGETITYAKKARDEGADVFGILFDERLYHEQQMFNHFMMISKVVPDIGLLIHFQKLFCGKTGQLINFPLSVLNGLADVENFVATKEDHKDDNFTEQTIDILNNRLAIIVSGKGKVQWNKFAHKKPPLKLNGAHSWLMGIGNAKPQVAAKFWEEHKKNNLNKCLDIIGELEIPTNKLKQKYGWHLFIKSVLEIEGIMSRRERLPLQCLPDEEHKEIEKVWKELNWNILND